MDFFGRCQIIRVGFIFNGKQVWRGWGKRKKERKEKKRERRKESHRERLKN